MLKSRKLIPILLPLLLCMAIPIIAGASDTVALPDAASFFSWEMIGTFSGAVALVVFIVQLLKLPIDRVWHIPTQIVVYIVSLIVLLLAQAFVPALGGLTWQSGTLCIFNAILVALTAMSAYSVAIEKPEYSKMVLDSIDIDVNEDGEIVATNVKDGIEIGTIGTVETKVEKG